MRDSANGTALLQHPNQSRQRRLADGFAAPAGAPRRAALRAYPRISLCPDPALTRNVATMVDAASRPRLADHGRARPATARAGAAIRPRAEGYRHHALRDRVRIAAISLALKTQRPPPNTKGDAPA